MKHSLFIILFLFGLTSSVFAQGKKIEILPSDNISYRDEAKYPGANILVGNVKVRHNGAILTCQKAFYYEDKNLLKGIGNVKINQGDTLIQTSDYIDYNANTLLSTSYGNVRLKDTQMTLSTDTLYFDRNSQLMYYNTPGTIVDTTNTLHSLRGRYFAEEKKFIAENKVSVKNPTDSLFTDRLIYYPETGQAFLNGPSTIYTSENIIYTEKGFYDSENKVSHLVKNARIDYQDRIIKGDSLFYNDLTQFASATGNIQIIDTINQGVTRGGYAEVYKALDSMFITNRAVSVSKMENDSIYIHGDTLLVTGQEEKRIIKAFHYVKFFSQDLRGKCDSLISYEAKGLTKMYYKPVLWSQESQITGDSIFMTSNLETEKLDSLKILTNAFMVQKDSTGFNQIRGKNMFGKFQDNEISRLLVNGNAEVINYGRDDKGELIGITKKQSSYILFHFLDNKINKINFMSAPEGKTYPPSLFPEEENKLKGFIWREDEMPRVVKDIFLHDSIVKPKEKLPTPLSREEI